jgi:hypothetical protein
MHRLLPLVAVLAACSDYDVSQSDLSASSESDEVLLDDGTSVTLLVRAVADGEAMAANPSSFARATVFGVTEGGSPRLVGTLGAESGEVGLAPTGFLELTLDDPFAGCDGEAEGAPSSTTRADGGCEVEMPVELRAEGGTVSLQLDAYVQLNFARREPPGTLEVSVSVL